MNNEFETVGLYEHNAASYKKVKESFEENDVVGIVHATGTGKSYNSLQLAYDNKDKKILYVVPSNAIIEHIKKIIEDNPNLDLERDFPNLEFRTYQSFVNLSREEINVLDIDMLILDEFHHIGAPVWGQRINTIIETHPNIKVFGMTAYTVRDRATPYERDMANPDTDELFSDKIVSRYDLCDAMLEGVLPKPIYKSAYVKLMDSAKKLEERVEKLDATSKEYQEYMKILSDAKKRIHEAPSIKDVVKKNLKKDGKYIYFCPPSSEENVNDMETIIKEVETWCSEMGLTENDYVLYQTTSKMGIEGKENREAFYNDVTIEGESAKEKLQIMFAINQYNEGVHAPNIDGVIMGRGTTSDIVYFEQLGRALSVRGNTKEKFEELEKLTKQQLLELCRKRDIPVNEETPKEEIIEKLIAPVVIDLTNNYEFIKELEDNLKDRFKEYKTYGYSKKRLIKISDPSFDIEIENQDLYEMLRYVSDRLTMTWSDKYEYAKIYYEKHHNLEVSRMFKTNDGYTYDENGLINLGQWISNQRKYCNLESDRGKLLTEIGMIWDVQEYEWQKMYEYAKIYYEKHHNLEVPQSFKTNDGYKYDEFGKIKLGQWIRIQRQRCNSESARGKLLTEIGMRFENKYNIIPWSEMYEYLKIYYEKYHNLEVPERFKTNDGFTQDKDGKIYLGRWISNQRKYCNPGSEHGKLLTEIGMIWNVKEYEWQKMYDYAKIYYEKHDNLEVPQKFKTNDGFTEDKNGKISLGRWIGRLRQNCNPESKHGKLLKEIGMIWNVKDNKEKISNLCDLNNINYEINKNILEHISIQELESKIKFLQHNNIEFLDDQGKLHEIFSMSSASMKEKYGISLEQLIKDYYIKEKIKIKKI